MGASLTILIVGGYGTFGGRLVELLEHEPRLVLIVAGRSQKKAAEFCAGRRDVRAKLVPEIFDRAGDVAARLAALKPDLVVDASGPFQNYGPDGYRLVEACIAARIPYLDLADGAGFVIGIAKFEAAARAAGIFVLSGVSSFPVLSAAAARHLAQPLKRVTAIRGGIAPSPHAGVGYNVICAIASYAGRRTVLLRGGKKQEAWPLTESLRYTIAPPGRVPVRNTLFSLVEVPDLTVLAELWPSAQEIWFGAGPVPEILHRALNGLAWLVRLGFLPSVRPFAGLMDIAMRRAQFGEDRGGCFIEVEGEGQDGRPARRSWHLLAEGRDGPLIPSMPAALIVLDMLAGKAPAPGARAAVNELSLGDYDRVFAGRRIHAGIREDAPEPAPPLYAQVLGEAWPALPAEIHAMHDVTTEAAVAGKGFVRRGENPLARLAAAIMGFPPAGTDVPVTVTFTVKDGVETWTRDFGGRKFSSRQYRGKGRWQHLLVERFGPLEFGMALESGGGKLRLVLRGWLFFGLPLPKFLMVRSDSYEFVENGRFHFNVEISHPLTGLIVHYRGWLAGGGFKS